MAIATIPDFDLLMDQIETYEKDCDCRVKIIGKDDPEHCKVCKGFINYRMGM